MKQFKLFLLLSFAVWISGCNKTYDNGFYQEIKSINKMVFANMTLTKTAIFNDYDNYKIGKRIAAYTDDFYLQAYIDLTKLKEQDLVFDDKNNTVEIFLPPIETEVLGRDIGGMKPIYDNIGLLRSNLSMKERAKIQEDVNQKFLDEVVNNPTFKNQLTETAQKKATKYFEMLFDSYGYKAKVKFKS